MVICVPNEITFLKTIGKNMLLTIPKDARKALELKEGDLIQISIRVLKRTEIEEVSK